jgi:hypothetical protein
MNKRSALFTLSGLALAVCTLMLAGLVASPQSTPDLTGQWNSNIGAVYEIQQSGSQFTWSAPGLSQSGTGTISGNNVTLSGPGWTVKGTITETDSSGNPTKIVGENGVVLFRTTGSPAVSVNPPAQPPVPTAPKAPVGGVVSVSGKWDSSIGATYEIQQSGNYFTWSAPSLNQSGTGTISGNNVTLSGPGWTIKGAITATDPSGNATKIVGENNVVLFRITDGQAGAVPPPAQQPAPQGQYGPGVTGDLTQFKDVPPLSPQLLAQVAAPATRRATIEALSASPTTKAILDKVAASAGKTVNSLKEQTLSGNPAVDAPVSPGSPPAQAFLDLWKAPVHISPTVPGPSYLAGGSTRVVGMAMGFGVYVHPSKNSLQMMAQKDYFLVTYEGGIVVPIDLPPGGGQYMVTIHAIDQNGTALDKNTELPIVDAYVEFPHVYIEKIPLVKNSTSTGLVGLFSESPDNAGDSYAPIDSMPHVSVNLRIGATTYWPVYITGVTVTRL